MAIRNTNLTPTGYYENLPDKHKKFVDEYLVDLNAWQAAIRAGYNPQHSYKLVSRSDIKLALAERRQLMAGERSIEGAAHVLNKLWDVSSADPRELVEIWKVSCRYCWGINGQYQYTKTEAHRRMQAHELGLNSKPIEVMWPRSQADYAAWQAALAGLSLDPQGGDGYDIKRQPNPNCQECGGDGITLQHVADTRKLTNGAKALYRGVKVSKEGKFEILMADQGQARDQLAKHYGVAVERKRILVRHLDADELTDEELVQALSDLEARINDQGTYEVVHEEPEKPPPRKLIKRPV